MFEPYFEERGRFRSQVALQIGAPIEVRPFLEAYRTDEIAAVRALTDAFGDGLTTVTRSHASWREAEVVHAAAEVAVLSDAPDAPDVYARQAVLQRDLGTAIAAHGGGSGMVYKGLEARIDDLRERLEALGTRTPAEVVHLDPERARRRNSGLAAASAVLAPIGETSALPAFAGPPPSLTQTQEMIGALKALEVASPDALEKLAERAAELVRRPPGSQFEVTAEN
mgnify:CR=1 FL=1